jgi:ABC-type multidrug transport system fused ATPase/permease subunit
VLERDSLKPPLLDGLLPEVLNKQEVIDMHFESCQGPNCQTKEAAEARRHQSCQNFLEIESYFSSVPLAVQILWSLSLISSLVAGVLIRAGRTRRVPWAKNDENAISTLPISPSGSDCRVRGLAAVTHEGKPLLQDVDLKLRLGTVTTICGQFGSGKSILLKASSQQRLRGISVSIEEGEAQLKTLQKPFLRQRDDSEMGEALSWLDSKGLDLAR